MKNLLFICLVVLFMNKSEAQKNAARINHIALSVLDLKRSTAFYTGVLQLDTIPEPFKDGRHTWLAIGNGCSLHLIQSSGPIATPPKSTHICLATASVEEFVKTLIRHQVPFEDVKGKPGAFTTRADGVKQIYFRDPDGYWIEINDSKD